MTRSAAILLLALTGCHGCEDGTAEPLAAPRAGEDLKADAAPRPHPLLPEELEGVFPPRWSIGDDWFVRTSAHQNDPFHGEVRLREVFHYRVVDVPRTGHEYYLIESEGGPRQMREHWFLVFRPPDYSEIASQGSMVPGEEIASLPHQLYGSGRGIFTFPMAPPFLSSNPPRFANPIHEELREEDGQILHSPVQTIEPTLAGLRVTLEVIQEFAMLRIVMEWRRGAPWWSSLRVYAKARDDDAPPDAGAEVLRDFADLFDPGEPLLPD